MANLEQKYFYTQKIFKEILIIYIRKKWKKTITLMILNF